MITELKRAMLSNHSEQTDYTTRLFMTIIRTLIVSLYNNAVLLIAI